MTRLASKLESVLEGPFKVDSIVPVAAPQGSEGVWHRYVITQGSNRITGMRAGARADIAVVVDEMVERLNDRRVGKHRAKGR